MRKLANFLDKYDMIIFDMDGVITSEQNYWDIAALTVFEMLRDEKYYGKGKLDIEGSLMSIPQIREEVFCTDELIKILKERGVNSNWDLAYFTFCFLASGRVKNSGELLDFVKANNKYAFELYELGADAISEEMGLEREFCARNGELWNHCQYVFQEWYLGSKLFEEKYGFAPKSAEKPPMYERELPIIPLPELKELLTLLSKDKKLGIGTGRPKFEIEQPLKIWDIRRFFDENSLVDYTDIMDAEKELLNRGREVALTKPHPWIFLKALFGRDYDDIKIIDGDYDKNKVKKSLVVGDAGADILAAKAMGADFAAVLTGAAGEDARDYFEQKQAEYIFKSIEDFMV